MTVATPTELSEVDRAAIQRRTLIVLWMTAVVSRGATSMVFPVSVSAIKDILGSETWAGLSTGATTVGAALSAAVLASFMQRHGRNPGLAGGFAAAAAGGALGIVAIQTANLLLFLPAMVLIGIGSGTSNLARYAAADLAAPERRSRDISTVLFAATFGAVLFPLFIGVAGDVAVDAGFDENAGGFAMTIALFVLAAIGVWLFMRPDPLVASGALVEDLTGSVARPIVDGEDLPGVPILYALQVLGDSVEGLADQRLLVVGGKDDRQRRKTLLHAVTIGRFGDILH